jgi:hypothetical protein
MAAKKPKKRKAVKKSAEWLKRSKAAKLGWKRRKALAKLSTQYNAKKKVVNAVRSSVSKKKSTKKRKLVLSIISETNPKKRASNNKDLEIRELKQKIAELERVQKRLAEIEATWVHDMDPDQYRLNGSIAVERSRARLLDDAEAIYYFMHMYDNDPDKLRNVVYNIADQHELPAREVWTLYYSP